MKITKIWDWQKIGNGKTLHREDEIKNKDITEDMWTWNKEAELNVGNMEQYNVNLKEFDGNILKSQQFWNYRMLSLVWKLLVQTIM